MASTLLGTDYVVQWRDFQARAAAPPGDFDAAAHISADFDTIGLDSITRLSTFPPAFTLNDNLTAKVVVGPASWRLQSASEMSGKQQVWLIKHEQGHFDVTALLLRDFYWRIRSLMGVRFNSINALKGSVADHAAATIDRVDELNHAYDLDTDHSRDGSEQWNWWSAIERARQLHRLPLESNADGQFLRKELVTALRETRLILA